MRDVKISITTVCNAICATCPVWSYPGEHMDLDTFKLMWTKLMLSDDVDRILLNNTGDMYCHPQRKEIFEYIEKHHYKPVIMTTNAGKMDYIPKIDLIIISFNGGTKESYESTTGLDFNKTVKNIKSFYPELEKVDCEIHCLMWEGNKGTEKDLEELWSDFPGRVRLSYKYDNQMQDDKTIEGYKKTERIYCDYLNMISVLPSGRIISCAHDFEGITNFGNIFTDELKDVMLNKNRRKKQKEHKERYFTGLCKDCNYNTKTEGRFVYIK